MQRGSHQYSLDRACSFLRKTKKLSDVYVYACWKLQINRIESSWCWHGISNLSGIQKHLWGIISIYMRTSSTAAWWNKNWEASGENKPNISTKEEIKVRNFEAFIRWTKWYYYEYGLAESLDVDDFQAKVASLEGKWKTTVPGFYQWFLKHRKVLFEESLIQSVPISSNVGGLYYQNNMHKIISTLSKMYTEVQEEICCDCDKESAAAKW